MNMLNDHDAKKIIAFNVNSRLNAMGKSRYWLAKQTGEWNSRIANVCRGDYLCSSGMLARIAAALDVSTDELLKPIRKVNSRKTLC